MNKTIDVESYLPLTEASYFILLSISSGQKHGYKIMKDVRHLSKQRVKLTTGTLYGAIKRMLDGGWIERLDDPSLENGGRQRKLYILTGLGSRVLEAEIQRLNNLVAASQLRSIGENG